MHVMAVYLASNFHTEKANEMAIAQSRLIFLPRVLYFGCPNQSGTRCSKYIANGCLLDGLVFTSRKKHFEFDTTE